MSVWPNEVRVLYMTATSSMLIDQHHAEKLKAHINRLWLSDTPEENIIHEISILADAMEGEQCAD
ncbi:hypothetical protein PL246_09650 [Salmonella enterica]|uniref:hypothetical protein n=1 Tax=Salmonella enterica TaxID=28901 RepID=UPI000CCC1947|nr:hypothetical protein [Salmonella enterica]EBX4202704.1 hypothetical protein [Salmonella enterica subsp. enterica serovar Oakland]ECC9827543.1 hypothetical protein [Salmonella enterica subsp. enterica]EHC3436039.1 hypothetical protein [Salmonella enterica subsp. enterica serovar Ouakam]EAW8084285.1 hypothetical protein [Salmonella enterica]EBI3714140.1 hypothetical protein [Salmonella enterica]